MNLSFYAIFLCTKERRSRQANSAATNLFNTSKLMLIGKPLTVFVCSEEHITFCKLA